MDAETRNPFRELRVDGGAAANDLLMQFQADLLGIPLVRPPVLETTALGAAYLAGLATDFWGSPEEIWKQREEGDRFEPKMERKEALAARERWRNAVARSRDWSRGSETAATVSDSAAKRDGRTAGTPGRKTKTKSTGTRTAKPLDRKSASGDGAHRAGIKKSGTRTKNTKARAESER
jgi:FGGY family of carbohydrate kinases, C-terminal domain